ncbi:hypothetical protein TNIN_388111 [Trichonephila inaurata madagascariensis]|uniref:Uncharacterized protein n=1 Tax=Trichonephila inaurata madagascariensis TaxID=2747483 RepID=A0A8X6XVW4_9ARAC|nr:hypothetical protein TNIN_388111 [Trichonephila inaurata madagascariensis]
MEKYNPPWLWIFVFFLMDPHREPPETQISSLGGFPTDLGYLDFSAQNRLLGGLFPCCVACMAGLWTSWIAPAFP